MTTCTVVVLTQPIIELHEAKTKSITDHKFFWMILILSFIGLIVLIMEWAYINQSPSKWTVFSFIGSMIIILGIIVRVWVIQVRSKLFTTSVQLNDPHQLIKTGPYFLLRHPSYTGAFLTFLGCGVLLESWGGVLIAGLAMGIAYALRITAEEQALLSAFGDEYRKYQQVTFRLIPFIY
ncbi:MAG: isoprenylcysteine carboxylmethyltransferase family protein [Saprospiraceae bacterium]